METATGEVKAISNLGRTEAGKYYERLNYAVGESHEPGSTFKLMNLVAALEDKVVDTSDVFDTEKGSWRIYNHRIKDSKRGGYGEISLAKAFEVSSNTAFAKMVHNGYKEDPEKYVDRLRSMQLDQELGLPIKGEGTPVIRYPWEKGWSGLSLAQMAYGYEVSMEMEKVPRAGYRIEGLWITGLQRKLTLKNLMFPIKLISSLFKSRKIVSRFKPDVVIGTGGFASGPLLQVASGQGIPCVLQEQNSYAGITNKLLKDKVTKICVAYDGMEQFFPAEKIVKTGNPIRKDLVHEYKLDAGNED